MELYKYFWKDLRDSFITSTKATKWKNGSIPSQKQASLNKMRKKIEIKDLATNSSP